MPSTRIPCAVLRGGTSKGLYFRAADLPADPAARDAVLLAAMGSPDPREIDGMGGGHPLTSKVAVVRPSDRDDADVDYLFLQVWPDRPEVSDRQNCGNILAGVGPFAIETGMVAVGGPVSPVRIHMVNTGALAVAHVATPDGTVEYEGDAAIDGVPGTHAPVPLEFLDVAGSTCGSMLPTGHVVDEIDGVRVTCIDNGMPVVCLEAAALGVTGRETPAELEADEDLKARLEKIRLAAGPLMNLGDVSSATVPKLSLLAPAEHGGAVSTRTFIPHRVHEAIGVLGAVSVATACMLPGSVAEQVSGLRPRDGAGGTAVDLDIEHPTGRFTVSMAVEAAPDAVGGVRVTRSALLRTARLLMTGEVHVPSTALPAVAP